MIRKIWDTIVFLFALSALVFPFVRLILSLNGVIIPFDGIMTVLAAPYLILFALAEVPVAIKGLMGRKIQPLNMTYYVLAVVMFMFVVPYQQVGTNLTGLNEFVIVRENLVVTNTMTFVMMWVVTSFVLCGFGQNGNGDLTWPLGLVVVLFEYVVKIATNLKTEEKAVVIKEAAKPNPQPAAQRANLREELVKDESTNTLVALRAAQKRDNDSKTSSPAFATAKPQPSVAVRETEMMPKFTARVAVKGDDAKATEVTKVANKPVVEIMPEVKPVLPAKTDEVEAKIPDAVAILLPDTMYLQQEVIANFQSWGQVAFSKASGLAMVFNHGADGGFFSELKAAFKKATEKKDWELMYGAIEMLASKLPEEKLNTFVLEILLKAAPAEAVK